MKKTIILGLAAVVVSGLAIGGAMIKGNAQNIKEKGDSTVSYSKESTSGRHLYSLDEDMLLVPEDIEAYTKEMSFLTDEEKARLVQDQKDCLPIYKEIEKLQEEIEKIENAIFEKHQSVVSEYDNIMRENEEIWKKLLNEECFEESEEDSSSYIRNSKVLTEDEKKLLLDQEERLTQQDKKLAAVYDEIEKETKGLSDQVQSLYDQAEEIQKKSQAIWDKIFEHEGASEETVEAIKY